MPIEWSTDEASNFNWTPRICQERVSAKVSHLCLLEHRVLYLPPKCSLIYEWKSHSPKATFCKQYLCGLAPRRMNWKPRAKTDIPAKLRCMLWKRKITKGSGFPVAVFEIDVFKFCNILLVPLNFAHLPARELLCHWYSSTSIKLPVKCYHENICLESLIAALHKQRFR